MARSAARSQARRRAIGRGERRRRAAPRPAPAALGGATGAAAERAGTGPTRKRIARGAGGAERRGELRRRSSRPPCSCSSLAQHATTGVHDEGAVLRPCRAGQAWRATAGADRVGPGPQRSATSAPRRTVIRQRRSQQLADRAVGRSCTGERRPAPATSDAASTRSTGRRASASASVAVTTAWPCVARPRRTSRARRSRVELRQHVVEQQHRRLAAQLREQRAPRPAAAPARPCAARPASRRRAARGRCSRSTTSSRCGPVLVVGPLDVARPALGERRGAAPRPSTPRPVAQRARRRGRRAPRAARRTSGASALAEALPGRAISAAPCCAELLVPRIEALGRGARRRGSAAAARSAARGRGA